ncbi:hypothetical protein Hanom_Chr17g01552861 [Helianthus anomalus]
MHQSTVHGWAWAGCFTHYSSAILNHVLFTISIHSFTFMYSSLYIMSGSIVM